MRSMRAKVSAEEAEEGAALRSSSLGVGVWRDDPLADSAAGVVFLNQSPDASTACKCEAALAECEVASAGDCGRGGEVHTDTSCPDETTLVNTKVSSGRRHGAAAKARPSWVEVGDVAPDFELEDSLGIRHRLSSYRGRKVLLSFFRFAGCPTTMMRMDLMKKHYDMLKRGGIIIICVFNSLPDMICNFAAETNAVVALSDRDKSTYKQYRVTESTKAFFQYEAEVLGKPKKYMPYFKYQFWKKDMHLAGARILPADFLINEEGVVVDLFRAQDVWRHHIAFERLEAFIPEGRRCKCNRGDCWAVRCRENHAQKTKGEKEDLRNRRTAVVAHTIAQ